ncbi:MAG: hypothetical protein AMXMBFR64_18380 [Myxococcales bacterium]
MHQVEVHVEGENIGALATPFTVGRDPECDVILPDSSVSRRHLKVTLTGSGLLLEDMGSSNGTWLDGRRITREVVPTGQSFVVGRVSMALRALEAGSTAAPYVPPRANGDGAQRMNTLAVDIPQGYFDPAPPPMRTFDCPGCGRKLRCATRTKRVKCRNCDEIIRFEGEKPLLERLIAAPPSAPPPPAHVQRPHAPPAPPAPPAAPQSAPPHQAAYAAPQAAPQPPRQQVAPAPAPIAPEPREALVPQRPLGQPGGTTGWVEPRADLGRPQHREDPYGARSGYFPAGTSAEPSILQTLPQASGGKAALGVLVVGAGIAAVSMFIYIAGVDRMLPFIIIGCVLALAGFVYAAAAWIRSSGGGGRSGGTAEERLHRLNRLRGENLISDEEYQIRRRDILRDL